MPEALGRLRGSLLLTLCVRNSDTMVMGSRIKEIVDQGRNHPLRPKSPWHNSIYPTPTPKAGWSHCQTPRARLITGPRLAPAPDPQPSRGVR